MLNHKKIKIVLSVFIFGYALFAQGVGMKVNVHGFISQGYLKSTENNYLANSTEGSFEFNEAAVNFMVEPSSRLRLGLQLFSRDLGNEGNNNMILDWAYGDYRWQDFLGVRLGKIKMPIGLYNYIRDVDLARSAILLPQGVYDETQRDFSMAMQGGSVYGYIPCIAGSALDYDFFLGTLTIPDAHALYWNWSLDFFASELARSFGATYNLGDRDIIGKTIYGASLKWQTPISGLLLAGSALQGELLIKSDLNINVPVENATQIVPVDVNIKATIDKYNIFSAEYTLGDFTVTGEYLDYKFETSTKAGFPNYTFSQPIIFNTVGYYGQLVYKPSDLWAVSTYYSEFYPDKNDKKGEKEYQLGQSMGAWQKDMCVTLRFDLANHWIIKLEGHYMDGVAQAYRFDVPQKRYWSLFALKTTYHF